MYRSLEWGELHSYRRSRGAKGCAGFYCSPVTRSIQEYRVPGGVPRFEIPQWRERFGVVAGITGRGEGDQPFDLGLWTGQPVGEVMGRWRGLRSAEPGFAAHVLGNQVHQTQVAWQKHGHTGWTQIEGVDGHATASAGLMLYVTVADCVPVYLVDPKARAIALLHAGWRGVAGGILERGMDVLSHKSTSSPSDIVMHCGISICAKCYEVGSEVIEAFGLPANEAGKAQADLPALLAGQARQLGIREITHSGWCSAHHRNQFFSHRASAGADGRMVAYLGLLA
jgi:YfiH family protein